LAIFLPAILKILVAARYTRTTEIQPRQTES